MAPKTGYDRILVPTDGSDAAARAVEHAVDLAEQYGAMLHALHVVDLRPVDPVLDSAMVYDALHEQGRTVLEEAAATGREAGLEGVETALVEGTPHRCILDYVDENGVDLVVMGTHGRTGLERYLLGSVAEKVVRLAEVPVLTVHAEPESG